MHITCAVRSGGRHALFREKRLYKAGQECEARTISQYANGPKKDREISGGNGADCRKKAESFGKEINSTAGMMSRLLTPILRIGEVSQPPRRIIS